ncbi:arginine decarboxylase [soil metagenome]
MNMSRLVEVPEVRAAKKTPARSHLTHALNTVTHKAIRWCTPSIDLSASQVINPYASDTSVSHESLGYPGDPSGVFKQIYDHAAVAYGAEHTLFSVNGTTGSNFMVLRALSKQIPNLRILSGRNIHKSIVVACEDYGINLIFLEPNIDQENQLFFPNSEQQILEGIARTKPQVLLLTNPTYEGMSLNLERIIAQVREEYPEIIIFIDEAWGAHLHFSDALPTSAMDAGADICVQSTHKQGGSLQQSGMIHWNDGRIDSDLLLDSYRSLGTTSPSYTLLASLDAAREMMEKKGKQKITYMLKLAKQLTDSLCGIEGYSVMSTEEIQEVYPSVYSRDETKVIVNVTKAGLNGYDVARMLEKRFNIIVEECNVRTILFLIPFRATKKDVDDTVVAMQQVVRMKKKANTTPDFHLNIPVKIPRVLEFSDVAKLLSSQIEQVPLVNAVGRIAAEYITPFPPGIPITIKGEELTQEIVDYYLSLKTYPNVHIVARDKTMETVWVVK